MDPIADMLTRIQNAGKAGKQTVLVSYSKLKFAVASVLLKEGYILSLNKKGRKDGKFIEISLAYEGRTPKILGVTRISKPSRRMYTTFHDIMPVRQGHGDLILSTPKGILTGKEARTMKVGGEMLFKIW